MIMDANGNLVPVQPGVLYVDQFGNPIKAASPRGAGTVGGGRPAFREGGWPNEPSTVNCQYCGHHGMT